MADKSIDEKVDPAGGQVSSLPFDVKKAGILRKLKTMKKKYFVLRSESESCPARLEYYDSEKKYRAGATPKRSICIKTCFNINRKVDAKQKLVIALYTKDDCFSVVADNETDLEEWLNAMLELQLSGSSVNGNVQLKPKFEHVWQVTIGEKSLASTRNMKGLYRICLTLTSLSLIKVEQSDNPETLEFPLMSIRRCGHTNNYFFIELGRSSIIGAGELWLETEHVVIAQNMHEATLKAMKSCKEHEDLGPLPRPRSSSNSENSRPFVTRRPASNTQIISYGGMRDRCDSMPSRPRTISEGQEINRNFCVSSNHPVDSLRTHSSYMRNMSYSPPGISNPMSPGSAACSTDSAGSSLSIDEFDNSQSDFALGRYSHSLPTEGAVHTEPPIKEEPPDDYLTMSVEERGTFSRNSKEADGYLHMAPVYSTSAPTGPSMFLNLTPSSSEVLCSSVSPPISQTADYLEMTSPTSPDGYIPMSPLGAADEKRSGNLASLSCPKNVDGYVDMGPRNKDALLSMSGYLEMTSSSLPKTFAASTMTENQQLSESPVVHSPEIQSQELYPLDKVKSLLSQTEDSSDDYIRPVRAYSMGSRPQPKKSHLTVHGDGSRIRAYSVGSQNAPPRNKNLSSIDQDLGSLKKIDVKAGIKSSSAPLLNNRPPRIRSSVSRGEVEDDLMEIDYDKPRSFSSGTDFSDQNFTIEPVGRSRSGSCSSSSTLSDVEKKAKVPQEKERFIFPCAGVTNFTHNSEVINDYMPMLSSGGSPKPTSKISDDDVAMAPETMSDTLQTNAFSPPISSECMIPSGDYVSLDPGVKYSFLGGDSQSNPIKSLVKSNDLSYAAKAVKTVSLDSSLCELTNSPKCASESFEKCVDDILPSPRFVELPMKGQCFQQEKKPNHDETDVQCLLCDQQKPKSGAMKAFISNDSTSNVTKKNHCAHTAQSFTLEQTLTECKDVDASNDCSLVHLSIQNQFGASSAKMQHCVPVKLPLKLRSDLINSVQSAPQAKGMSVPTSPTARSLVFPHVLPSYAANGVPKTPPPSPQSGSVTNLHVVSGPPLIASLAKQLTKPVSASVSQSAPNSRPQSVCGDMQLNYAALDLPPSAEDESATGSSLRTCQSLIVETKETPLSYAQIDFSSCRQASKDVDKENTSHL